MFVEDRPGNLEKGREFRGYIPQSAEWGRSEREDSETGKFHIDVIPTS